MSIRGCRSGLSVEMRRHPAAGRSFRLMTLKVAPAPRTGQTDSGLPDLEPARPSVAARSRRVNRQAWPRRPRRRGKALGHRRRSPETVSAESPGSRPAVELRPGRVYPGRPKGRRERRHGRESQGTTQTPPSRESRQRACFAFAGRCGRHRIGTPSVNSIAPPSR